MWRMLFCMFLVGQERAFAEDRRCDFSQPKRQMAEEEKKKATGTVPSQMIKFTFLKWICKNDHWTTFHSIENKSKKNEK